MRIEDRRFPEILVWGYLRNPPKAMFQGVVDQPTIPGINGFA